MVDQWPEKIERYFSLKRLSAYGKHVLISSVLAVLILGVTLAFYPDADKKRYPPEQYLEVDALQIKRNTRYFHHYLQQVKSNNGYLMLGTSESGTLEGANYWHWWNGDTAIDQKMSVLSGAGRCPDVFFPHVTASPESWRDVRVLLFLNPTYWRKKLNEPREIYQTRYLDKGFILTQESELKRYEAFDWYGKIFKDHETLRARVNQLGHYTDWLRSFFYTDFQILLETKASPYNNRLDTFQMLKNPEQYLPKLDTTLNVSNAFRESQEQLWFPVIDTASTYRSNVLSTFLQALQKSGAKVTVVIGPYNQYLAESTDQINKLPAYERLHQSLQDTLEKYSVPTVDLWHLSDQNNTFREFEHHSMYGGYLIYEELKKQLHETP